VPAEATRRLVSDVRAALTAVADPAKAGPMQAYMKSAMPFLGVSAPQRRRALRPVAAAWRPASFAAWERGVWSVFAAAEHREERYAALDLALAPRFTAYRDARSMPLVRRLAAAGAWWDLVDATAPIARDALTAEPAAVAPLLRAWAHDDDLWVRRVAVISQLQRKAGTDRTLLADVLEPNLARPEFFLRKAVGWALRDLSTHDPDWVRAYVAAHPGLSPLARREALRRITDAGDRRPG
jgi:3-methyladenine DNA glycosylase AlkD